MAKVFTLKFDDPDMMYEISQRFTSSRDEKGFPGSAWISRFTVCGDCATIELDVASGRFRFMPISGRPDPWPKKDDTIAAQLAEARAALEEIAALQTKPPLSQPYHSDGRTGIALGRWDAAEIARKALGGGR